MLPHLLIAALKSGNINEVIRNLLDHGIYSKKYEIENLILLYHKFDVPIFNDCTKECRSLIIDKNTLKIICYTGYNPVIYNNTNLKIIKTINSENIINICYEGTYLSLFNHNNKWYLSTRRCLDSNMSIYKNKSHYQMFEEIIKNAGYNNFDTFCEILDKNQTYYFVLLHYENIHEIDYTYKFGSNYLKLCLSAIKNELLEDINLYINKPSFASYDFLDYIFIAEKINLSEYDLNTKYNDEIKNEGIIINNSNSLIKIQNINYQYKTVIGSDKNIYKGLILLYQNNKLMDYVNNPNEHEKKIINPLNNNEYYDLLGVINSVFKVTATEIHELFNQVYDNDGSHKNINLYQILPKEYKYVLYKIKGLYYNNKHLLEYSAVYSYIKEMHINILINFLKIRKIMINYCKVNKFLNKELNEFLDILSKSNKTHYKLCTIYTNKLFPNISNTDFSLVK